MLLRLTVRHFSSEASQPSTYHYRFDKDEVLLGRDEAVDVCLPHPVVSLVHLRFRRKKGRLFVLDGGSTNGTLLDGRRLVPGEPVELGESSRLKVGPFEIAVEFASAQQPTAPEDTAHFARQMVLAMLGAAEPQHHPYLEVENGPQKGQRLEVPPLGAALVVGRGPECDLRLEDADASRRHLEVRAEGPAVILRDLGSKNGLEVNGRPAAGPYTAHDGDVVRVGETRLRLAQPVERYLRDLRSADGARPEAGSAPKGGSPCRVEHEEGVDTMAGSGAVDLLDPSPRASRPPFGGEQRVVVALVVAAGLVLLITVAGLVYLLL
jgi:pSer/pThr/pTyr-binding forkhead associated (FHA) protein